jgi:membrane-associated phospholipid phosphatase
VTPFENTLNWLKKPWVVAIWALLAVLSYYYADQPVATYFYHLQLRNYKFLYQALDILGKSIVYDLLFLLAALYCRYLEKNRVYEARCWYLLTCILVPNMLALVLKIILGRARPELLLTQDLYGFYWFQITQPYFSFPSGHTTTIISLAAALGVLFPRFCYLLLLLGFVLALSRVILYFHYLSDVLVSTYFSLLVVGMLTQYIKKNHYWDQAWVK